MRRYSTRGDVLAWVMRSLVLIAVLGCASSSTTPNASSIEEERGPTRADIDPGTRVAPSVPSYRVSVHADHVDVHSDDGFPGRALDPVLHAGDLELHDYEHVGIDTLRFRSETRLEGPFELHWGSEVHELAP